MFTEVLVCSDVIVFASKVFDFSLISMFLLYQMRELMIRLGVHPLESSFTYISKVFESFLKLNHFK